MHQEGQNLKKLGIEKGKTKEIMHREGQLTKF